MDIAVLIRNRLEELGLGQRDLARAAHVTESYISQLITQKKLPPAPKRTDMYGKIGHVLKLPHGQLAKLADQQRREHLRKRLGNPPPPLLHNVRELILRKCHPRKVGQIRAIFEKQPFGELERFVTQKLLGVVKSIARQELDNPSWMRNESAVRSGLRQVAFGHLNPTGVNSLTGRRSAIRHTGECRYPG